MPVLNLIKIHLLKFILLALWTLLVLYPNPAKLTASLYRLKNPPVMPLQVTDIAMQLEGNAPFEIEQFVYKSIPYQFDWEVYNMPWYFPTLDEVLQNGKGDCKSRYLLFASLLEELKLPYNKNVSLTHIWVGYEGKKESKLKNSNELLFIVDQNGNISISLPRSDLRRSGESFYRGFWEAMPADKKLLMVSGLPLIFGMFSLHTLNFEFFPTPFATKLRRYSAE